MLECAADTEAAGRLGVARAAVGAWRSRFVAGRLDGLADEPRPGVPREVADEQVENVLADTLEPTPRNATRWSRASMAARSGLSGSTVRRIWKAFGLKPHRWQTFKLSKEPMFIAASRRSPRSKRSSGPSRCCR